MCPSLTSCSVLALDWVDKVIAMQALFLLEAVCNNLKQQIQTNQHMRPIKTFTFVTVFFIQSVHSNCGKVHFDFNCDHSKLSDHDKWGYIMTGHQTQKQPLILHTVNFKVRHSGKSSVSMVSAHIFTGTVVKKWGSQVRYATSRLAVSYLHTWIPWQLSFRYINCTGQFTPKMKANAKPRLLSSLVWIDSSYLPQIIFGQMHFLLISENETFSWNKMK